MNRFSTSIEISFHGLRSKSKDFIIRKQIAWLLSSQLIILLFLRNNHLQTDFQQIFFSPVILRVFRKFLQRMKKTFRKLLESPQKKPPVAKCYFSKVAGFYRNCHLRCSVKNGILRKVFTKFTEKHLCQRLYFDKRM